MSNIRLLDQSTINKIAAGEVIDRPSSVVKELLENAIDAKASSITVEIKEGGISFIRITDNGTGIPKEDISVAFLRHSTSKIKDALDLLTVASLGFRGEALSSIAAVSQVELISKTESQLTGTRYLIEGGEEKQIEEIGAPNGTTFIIRNLFYNTPARRKFLKTAATEASYISSLVERIALSHPEVSIRFINNNANKLFTPGNNELKTIIYNLYGKDITENLLKIQGENEFISISGYIGKPVISRGNRNYENFFINGRYIRSGLFSKAVEEAYKPYLMQHKYPFAALHVNIDQSMIDVNVHPAKMEIRFKNEPQIYEFLTDLLTVALQRKEHIPQVTIASSDSKETIVPKQPAFRLEPFEEKRISMFREESEYKAPPENSYKTKPEIYLKEALKTEPKQIELFEENFISTSSVSRHKILGQAFDTYWLVQFEDKLFIIDQHAAHEKVLYERILKSLETKDYHSQMISPPIIVSLSMLEEELYTKYLEYFEKIGFEIEHFGGNEYAIRAVPGNLFSLNTKELFLSILDDLSEETLKNTPTIITEKIASISCKAAVKGNHSLSQAEVNELIRELLTLENPYHCPHGRPTIISMSRQELEKKFKRIL